jgi:hypothetical protein
LAAAEEATRTADVATAAGDHDHDNPNPSEEVGK